MKSFEYTIKDELGIHARPAGMLVKEAKNFASECTITKDGKTKKLTQLDWLFVTARHWRRSSVNGRIRVP